MQEFSSVTASSYDADSLTPLLNEKSAEGWEVVSIVSAGTNIVAYLTRESDGVAETVADDVVVEEAVVETTEPVAAAADDDAGASPFVPAAAGAAVGAAAADVVEETPAVEEPAGWGSEPDEAVADDSVAGLAAEVGAEEAAAEAVVAETAVEEVAVAETAAVEETAAAAPEAAVPAGWYADPSGRFELRYWDGAAWTEHVSRAGQQFTDPPVA